MVNAGAFASIAWRVIVAAKSEEKAGKLVVSVSEALGTKVSVGEITPYWKVPGQYEATLTTDLGTSEVAEASYGFLSMCLRLGAPVQITGPREFGANEVELEGILASPSIPGVVWVEARLASVRPGN